MTGFLHELKRRKVFKVGAAYLLVGWVAVQAAGIGFPAFDAPPWLLRIFILVALLGFPLALVMAWIIDATPEGLKFDASVTGNKRVFAGAALLMVLALGWYFQDQPAFRKSEPARPAVKVSTVVTRADPHSIAVLPFVDMSQAKDHEYFSDGLSEELMNLLAQLPQLHVVARTSSFSFKGKDVDVATIARTLNVAHVLEGSVRKSGNTLRVTAQLVRASDSTHVWSQTYNRELTDVFKVQDEIAHAVVAALKVELLPDQSMSNAHRSDNAEAYNQFLLGNQFRKRANPENWQRAVAAYQRAIALDPNYAAAYAGLAQARGGLADSQGDVAGMDRALADADKAIALAPDLADVYVARGTARLSFTRDWTGAQADLEKALELNPRDSAVQGNYGRMLIMRGRVADAIAVSRKAIELDPLASDAWSQLGRMLNAAGEFPEARKALDRALEINPESHLSMFHRGMNSLLQGQAQEALEIFRKAGSGYGGAGVAMAEHSLGHPIESQQALDQEIAKFSQGLAYQIAEVYAWRGEKDKAFQWLDRAYAQRDGGLSFVRADPLLASLEGDPRFAALLEKMGLPK